MPFIAQMANIASEVGRTMKCLFQFLSHITADGGKCDADKDGSYDIKRCCSVSSVMKKCYTLH